MANCSPSTLLESAKCFSCLSTKELQMVITQLLCNIEAAGGGAACANLEGALDDPTGIETPTFVGQVYIGPNSVWQATGLTSADWVEICSKTDLVFSDVILSELFIGSDSPTSISLPNALSALGTVGSTSANLISFSAPLLSNVIGTAFVNFDGCVSLATVNLVSLSSVALDFIFTSTAISSMNLPNLVTVGGDFKLNNCPSLASLILTSLTTCGAVNCNSSGLVSVSVPVWIPTNGQPIDFGVNALDVTSVNLILARCVASGVTTCVIDLSGGTNAAPAGQGLLDKAALILAGNTVLTN